MAADIVKKHGASIAVAIKDWVDRYRSDRAAATAELLRRVFARNGKACGISF